MRRAGGEAASTSGSPSAFDDDYAARQIARSENPLRARVKQFYLDRILRQVDGPTVDIGCGAGQLLEQLPAGSLGLEVNPVLVQNLQARGLNVMPIVPDATRIDLGEVRPGTVRTAVLSHVLEHFADAASVLRRLLADCAALGISRLVVVVPGSAGFAKDDTHKTFVTLDYLAGQGLVEGAGFAMTHRSYFPGDMRSFGGLFAYHELMVVYDLRSNRTATQRPGASRGSWVQLGKFVLVGLLNTAFSYAIYVALVFVGMNFALANLTALVIGIGFSFKTQGILVFNNVENRRLLRFILVWLVLYLFGILMISLFISLGFDSYASGALAIPFTTVLSYVAQRFFVFR